MLRGPREHVVDRFERTGLEFDLDSTSFDKESDAAGIGISRSIRRGANCGGWKACFKLLSPIVEDFAPLSSAKSLAASITFRASEIKALTALAVISFFSDIC